MSLFPLGILSAAAGVVPDPVNPVAGFILELDASNASSLTFSSGTLVSQWNDLSGNGNNFSQATQVNQPSLNATQNGLPALTFGNSFLARTSLNWGNTATTLFIAGKEDKQLVQIFQNLFTSGSGQTGNWGYGVSNTGAVALFDIGQNANAFNQSMSSGNADVLSFTTSGNGGTQVTANFFLNGVADSSNPLTLLNTFSSTGAVLGAAAAAGEPYFGTICEVILYPTQLNTTDRNLVEAYLKAKWGTT